MGARRAVPQRGGCGLHGIKMSETPWRLNSKKLDRGPARTWSIRSWGSGPLDGKCREKENYRRWRNREEKTERFFSKKRRRVEVHRPTTTRKDRGAATNVMFAFKKKEEDGRGGKKNVTVGI